MFPFFFFLSFPLIILLDIWLYRAVVRRFHIKRRFVVPFLTVSMLWPLLESFWSSSFYVHGGEYIRVKGSWYTFDTRHFFPDFIYNQFGPFMTPILLSFIDVLILGTLICIPIYIITLIHRWWVK